MSQIYMQYGCGLWAPETWLNFDASPTLRFERIPVIGRLYQRNVERFPENVRYGDAAAGLPIASGSCRGIYCSHVLEHLSKDDCTRAVANTFAYLAPGGTFRLIVPDLAEMVRNYQANTTDDAANRFIANTGMGSERRDRGLAARVRESLGTSRHLWLWDERSLGALLRSTGFVDVRRCAFGDSADPRFREVELEDRFIGSVGMEARRPA